MCFRTPGSRCASAKRGDTNAQIQIPRIRYKLKRVGMLRRKRRENRIELIGRFQRRQPAARTESDRAAREPLQPRRTLVRRQRH
jgi:hypothetical protein